jgi:hypothetical protein
MMENTLPLLMGPGGEGFGPIFGRKSYYSKNSFGVFKDDLTQRRSGAEKCKTIRISSFFLCASAPSMSRALSSEIFASCGRSVEPSIQCFRQRRFALIWRAYSTFQSPAPFSATSF